MKTSELVKWWPIITNLVVLAAFLCALFNAKIYDITSPLFGASLTTAVFWYYFSIEYKFCFWHRLLIINLIIVSLIVLINNILIRFGFRIENYFYIRLIIIICLISIFLSAFLYLRFGSQKKCNTKTCKLRKMLR